MRNTDETKMTLKASYERPLTADELSAMTRDAPSQIHLAPNQDGVTAHWFEMSAQLPDRTVNVGAFYVRADTVEAAQQHAVVVLEKMRAVVERGLHALQQPPA